MFYLASTCNGQPMICVAQGGKSCNDNKKTNVKEESGNYHGQHRPRNLQTGLKSIKQVTIEAME